MFSSAVIVQEGLSFPGKAMASLLCNGLKGKENHIENVSKRVYNYMKDKKETSISELVKEMNESADIILNAISLLKKKGLVKEN